jgi:vacuolar-type H+-ATPase subunit F/Vma7
MARLMMVAPPELAAGFRLAGTDVVAVSTPEEAEVVLERLAADPEVGVIGVSSSLLEGIDPAIRTDLEDMVAPVVVGVPSGGTGIGEEAHRARLASLLQRAIGFRISFTDEEAS